MNHDDFIAAADRILAPKDFPESRDQDEDLHAIATLADQYRQAGAALLKFAAGLDLAAGAQRAIDGSRLIAGVYETVAGLARQQAAAEAWRQKRLRGEAVTAAEARAAHLRRMHARFTALRKDGVAIADMPLAVQRGEREYQRESKRRRRQERAARAGIVYRLHSEARRHGYEAAA